MKALAVAAVEAAAVVRRLRHRRAKKKLGEEIGEGVLLSVVSVGLKNRRRRRCRKRRSMCLAVVVRNLRKNRKRAKEKILLEKEIIVRVLTVNF